MVDDEQFGSIDDENPCPFDPTHTHKSGRLSVESLIRCRQKHPELAHFIVPCKFNYAHWIHVDAMKEHLTSCKDFKQWIYTQTLNGFPLSLDPRELLIKPSPNEAEASEVKLNLEELTLEELEKSFSEMPSFLQDLGKSKD